jgi:hypothetical protein
MFGREEEPEPAGALFGEPAPRVSFEMCAE